MGPRQAVEGVQAVCAALREWGRPYTAPAHSLGPMGMGLPPCLPSSARGRWLCWALALPAVGQGQRDLEWFPLVSKIRPPIM